MTHKINISLPEHLSEYIEKRVAEGGFTGAEDYVRSLIAEDCERQAKAKLEQLLLDGLKSGEPVAATEGY